MMKKNVVAFGSSIYDAKTDDNVRKVFERADEQMYLKKKELKKLQHN